MKLFDATNIPVLGKAMDVYALRHKIISSNIANITTSGYRAKHVSFEDELAGAVESAGLSGERTDGRHMAIGGKTVADAEPAVEEGSGADGGDAMASGANDVDLDVEMAELAKNQIRYKFSARLLQGIFKSLQESIRGSQ